jgi:hypothetical protein
MMKVELPLTDAEAAELDKLMASGDEKAMALLIQRLERLAKVQDLAAELRERLLRDVVLVTHHWMHVGNHEKAHAVLCLAAAIVENEPLSDAASDTLAKLLDEGNSDRARFDCQGHA